MSVMRNKEEWKVYGNVFSKHSLELLFKLSSQGYFEELESAISVGKEANIFTARTKDGTRIIVKIYRLENCNFNKMYDYLVCDPRYVGVKRNQRQVVFSWVQREYKNLLLARKVIRVPKPIAFKDNVLLMEFIGDNDAAPQVKNSHMPNPCAYYQKILRNIKKLYDSGLIHVDLSAFNILNYNDEPVFIDFSQSLPVDASHAREFLRRDVHNVCTYFRKHFAISEEDEEAAFQSIIEKKVVTRVTHKSKKK